MFKLVVIYLLLSGDLGLFVSPIGTHEMCKEAVSMTKEHLENNGRTLVTAACIPVENIKIRGNDYVYT